MIQSNVEQIKFSVTGGSISVAKIVVKETPMDIQEVANEEIDKHASFVDNTCLVLGL